VRVRERVRETEKEKEGERAICRCAPKTKSVVSFWAMENANIVFIFGSEMFNFILSRRRHPPWSHFSKFLQKYYPQFLEVEPKSPLRLKGGATERLESISTPI